MEALPHHAHALYLVGGEVREVDVDQRAPRHRHVDQRAQDPGRPAIGGGKAVAPLAHRLAEGNGRDARQRPFHRGRDGAGIGDIVAQVLARVDAGDDEVRLPVGEQLPEAQVDRIGRRAGNGKALLAMLAQAHRGMQGERMARARLLLCRGTDPHVVGQFGGDRLQQFEAGGADAIVVGEQDAHQAAVSSLGSAGLCRRYRAAGRAAPRPSHRPAGCSPARPPRCGQPPGPSR